MRVSDVAPGLEVRRTDKLWSHPLAGGAGGAVQQADDVERLGRSESGPKATGWYEQTTGCAQRRRRRRARPRRRGRRDATPIVGKFSVTDKPTAKAIR